MNNCVSEGCGLDGMLRVEWSDVRAKQVSAWSHQMGDRWSFSVLCEVATPQNIGVGTVPHPLPVGVSRT
jgi:hypothetical protein